MKWGKGSGFQMQDIMGMSFELMLPVSMNVDYNFVHILYHLVYVSYDSQVIQNVILTAL